MGVDHLCCCCCCCSLPRHTISLFFSPFYPTVHVRLPSLHFFFKLCAIHVTWIITLISFCKEDTPNSIPLLFKEPFVCDCVSSTWGRKQFVSLPVCPETVPSTHYAPKKLIEQNNNPSTGAVVVIIGLGFPCLLLRWFPLTDISGIQGKRGDCSSHCLVWQDPFHHPPSGYIISNYSMICSSITITRRVRERETEEGVSFHILRKGGEPPLHKRGEETDGGRKRVRWRRRRWRGWLDEFSRRIVRFFPTLLHLLYWGLLLEHRGKGLYAYNTHARAE